MISIFIAFGQIANMIPPPPPRLLPEFFSPTVQTHSISAPCNGSPMVMVWHFNGNSVKILNLKFGKFVARKHDIAELNKRIDMVPRDMIARMECDPDSALISLIESRDLGVSNGRRIRFIIDDGKIEFL